MRWNSDRGLRFALAAFLLVSIGGLTVGLLGQTAPPRTPAAPAASAETVRTQVDLVHRAAPDVLARLAAGGEWPAQVGLRALHGGKGIELTGTRDAVAAAEARVRAFDTPVRRVEYRMRLLRSDGAAASGEPPRRVQPPPDVKPPTEVARQQLNLAEGARGEVALADQVDVQVKAGAVESKDAAVRDAQITFTPRITKLQRPGAARPVVLTTRLVNRARTVFVLPAEVSPSQTLMVEMEARIEPLAPVPGTTQDGVPR